MLRRTLLAALCGLVCVALGSQPAWAQKAGTAKKKIRVLLVTGSDIAPYHDWRENSEATREVLVDSGRFEVRVCEDPLILESKTALEAYDVIAFLAFDRRPKLTEAAQSNLLDFVRSGKGFYVQHLASASYKEWKEFAELCGRHWVFGVSGHTPRSVFPVKIVKDEHPITKGLTNFKTFDELYSKLQGDSPIEVLAAGDSDFSHKTEPLLFVRTFGRGRVVHNALGHDRKAIVNPGTRTLILRGVEWAATGQVTIPPATD